MASDFIVAGVMSGTSLDGLDIALCGFEEIHGKWHFEVLSTTTIPYSQEWKKRFAEVFTSNGATLAQLHSDFGHFIGQCVLEFIEANHIEPDLVSSHGHTIFHQPDKGYTFQVGCGAAISAITGIDTVTDLRSTDVALGGQGAPLVPIGDFHLFGGHRFCLNLGGIANISYDEGNQRMAFDICPVNMALNFLSEKAGLAYDEGGEIALRGEIVPELLEKLNQLDFYRQKAPKSLGREWFETSFLPLIEDEKYSLEDRMRTVVQHIGVQISNVLTLSPGTTMLTTGGGAYNNLLIEVIEEQVSRHGIHVVVPDSTIVEFKEAIIFAFLGLLRSLELPNSLSSVTGARQDSIGGAIYKGC